MVLAVAHPLGRLPPPISLRSLSPILAATFVPPRGERLASPSASLFYKFLASSCFPCVARAAPCPALQAGPPQHLSATRARLLRAPGSSAPRCAPAILGEGRLRRSQSRSQRALLQ